MSLDSIANKKACSGASGANTGKLGCLSLFGTPTHLLAITKGTVIPGATVLNDAYIRPLVIKGNMIPLVDSSAFEDVSSEDAYSTNTSGVKRLNLKGLPEYKLMFEEGHEFYRELSELASFKSWDFAIGDEEGNWLIATVGTGYKGFTAGHVTPALTKRKVQGGDAESKSLLVQFLDRLQFDKNYAVLHADQLDWTPSELPVINGVTFKWTADPTNLDTTLKFSAYLSSDEDTPVEGLVVADLKYTVNAGAEVPSLLVEDTPGNYTATVAAIATNDELTLDTWHTTHLVNVADSSTVLFRAKQLTAKVI